MPHGFDHIVHAVRDLDAAAELYRRLGFIVGARNRHPWGTHNRVVQLRGVFIELLTFAEPDKLGDDGFSAQFGAFHRDFLANGEGLSMLLLSSKDAAADAEAFRAAGIGKSDAMRFEREGERPDGSTVKLAFTLAFARDPAAPDLGFAVCQHHYPENFWNPAFQAHANGAAGVTGLVVVAEDPAAHAGFLRSYAEGRIDTGAGRISCITPRGEIIVVNSSRYREEFALDVRNVSRGTRFAAIRIAVPDMNTFANTIKAGGVPAVERGDRLIVPADAGLGATFIFEPAVG